MSTRGAIGFIVKGKPYVTYNHSDSYPEGLGQDLVNFCIDVTNTNQLEKFKELVSKVTLVQESDSVPENLQKQYKQYFNGRVGSQPISDWYCLLRGIQGIEIFEEILNEKLEHMIDSFSFLKDSLFCEYAYIFDLDTEELLFFRGFNKSPLSKKNNPLGFVNDDAKSLEWDATTTYYPVKLVGKCSIDNIPSDWEEKFYHKEEEGEK